MGGSINNCQHTDGRNVDKRNMNWWLHHSVLQIKKRTMLSRASIFRSRFQLIGIWWLPVSFPRPNGLARLAWINQSFSINLVDGPILTSKFREMTVQSDWLSSLLLHQWEMHITALTYRIFSYVLTRTFCHADFTFISNQFDRRVGPWSCSQWSSSYSSRRQNRRVYDYWHFSTK
jgi:hypothetical protein